MTKKQFEIEMFQFILLLFICVAIIFGLFVVEMLLELEQVIESVKAQ
mgnify:CR=1 FL=1|tara:strand:+ start:511 stop:651 length:141 start_codon:yes stop_codon:yes gene_type:complete